MLALEGYEIFAELQRGAWVAIFKAFDHKRGQTVLVKSLLESSAPAAVQGQLAAERDLSRRCAHPNLRRVCDAGEIEGRTFLVLEYVEGPTLAELIRTNLPIELCAWIAKQVAGALAAVHHEGVLHRDLKPQNIFISLHGEVKLGDLGLAIDASEECLKLAGTPAYFSPEIVLGKEITARSDLFSLGAVLYEMLIGEPPFADHTTSAILHRIANLNPIPIERLRPEVPAELTGLCRQLLAKDPESRCGGAEEVIAILEQFEHNHGLKTSTKTLAEFLERPVGYQHAQFVKLHNLPLPQLPPPEKPSPASRKRRVLSVLVLASMFFGLIFVDWAEYKTEPSAATQPLTQITQSVEDGRVVNNPPRIQTDLSPPTLKHEAASPAAVMLRDDDEAQPSKSERQSLHDRQVLPIAPAPGMPENAASRKNFERRLVIISEPRAHVFVEGEELGLTPLNWTLSQPDLVYEMKFVSPILPAVNTLVTASIIDSDTLRLNLWKEVAYLEVTVNPWGEIWIDGKSFDTTPLAAPLALTPGLHEIDIRHPQLGTRSQRIVISKGDTLRKIIDFFTP